MKNSSAFTGAAAQNFAEYADTVRGFARYELVRQNLEKYLNPKPQNIADIGGGAAVDAVWLAELGHSVTIVEPALEQIALAQAKVARLSPEVANRISIIHGTAETLVAEGKEGSYDWVLSHGVAMYVDDVQQFVASLAKLLKPTGQLSLLEKGWAGAYARVIAEQDYAAAEQLRQENRFTNHMGKTVWTFQSELLKQYVTDAGLLVLEWTGVRVAHDADYRLAAELATAERTGLIQLEHQLGTATDTRGMGQMLHFIAQKHG